jgi:hypothetical protein
MDDSAIAFGRPLPDVWTLSNTDFLASISWSRSAPSSLVEAARRGDLSAAVHSLCKEGFGVASQKGRKKASARARHKRSLWSRLAFDDSPGDAELFALWENFDPKFKCSGTADEGRRKNKRSKSRKHKSRFEAQVSELSRWVERAGNKRRVSPVATLVLLEILQQTAQKLPSDLAWKIWRLALTASAISCAQVETGAAPHLTDDQRVLIDGELPLAAAAVFGVVKKSGKLHRGAARFLNEQLEESTDTDGTPNAHLLPRISLWLASLVRSTEWARRAGRRLWEKSAAERFKSLMERAAAICRADGCLALANGRSRDVAGLLADASQLVGWKRKSPPSRYVLAVGNGAVKPGRAVARSFFADHDHPATQSDWARMACLRNNWSATPDTLVVAHHGEMPLIDLATLGRPLISGVWELQIVVDGNPVPLKGDWECSCWFSDDDADFIELHATLDGGVQVERQLLLSRDEHFALFADAVTVPEGRRVEYTSRLPLLPSVLAEADTMSREMTLRHQGVRARAFPLALPDERVLGIAGRFAQDGPFLELQQQGEGGLFAPVLIDWDRGRRHGYADWRCLTVTEDGRILKRSAASAHRIRIGDHQLFCYRSLRNSGEMRAILGHHTPHETVIGLFAEDGEVDPIVNVEASSETQTAH